MIKVSQQPNKLYTVSCFETHSSNVILRFHSENTTFDIAKAILVGRDFDELELEHGLAEILNTGSYTFNESRGIPSC